MWVFEGETVMILGVSGVSAVLVSVRVSMEGERIGTGISVFRVSGVSDSRPEREAGGDKRFQWKV